MALHNIEYNLQSDNRTGIRIEVAKLFTLEEPGIGKGENCSKYHYIVEHYGEYSIVLKRPTGLNKDFDFTVNISGMYFKKNRRYSNPSHNDIFKVLNYVKNNYEREYDIVAKQIINIFQINEYSFKVLENVVFPDGDGILRPIAIILLAIKWLFIEQDITYWNWSGRNMLYNHLIEMGLV